MGMALKQVSMDEESPSMLHANMGIFKHIREIRHGHVSYLVLVIFVDV